MYKVPFMGKRRCQGVSWLNGYGAIFVLLLLVPNIAFAVTHKDGFENGYQNKVVEFLEQIGRFGSFGFMIFCPPAVCKGWWFDGGKTVYLIAGAGLVFLYLIGWVIFWRENSVRKSLTLSVLPSLLFLESGILTLHIPLIITAALFAPCHIIISYQNARIQRMEKRL